MVVVALAVGRYLGAADEPGGGGGARALNMSGAAGALYRECAAVVVDARCQSAEYQPNKQKCIG